MAIRNDAGLMLESMGFFYFFILEEEERGIFRGWRRLRGMEKPGVFSIEADFE